MKQIKGNITIYCSKEYVKISLEDSNSSTEFLELKMDAADFTAAIGRRAYLPCSIQLRGLEKVGLKMEHKKRRFEIAQSVNLRNEKEKEGAMKEIQAILDWEGEGWVVDDMFNQNTVEWERNGDDLKKFLNLTIRRYLKPKENERSQVDKG